tara:strand:- start:1764 stop:2456 length:693 start_codon:yes stop_codon:yes gene_type:complete
MVFKTLPNYLIESNVNDLSELVFSNSYQIRKKPALFLDRDGVLIKDCHYISSVKQVKIENGAKKLVRFAYIYGFHIVVVSNQSGISRNKISWNDYFQVTNKMISLFGNPNPFSAIYANSQGPNSKKNNWRKPSPNMIMRASKLFNIDIDKSILIGDRLTDLQAGLNAGIKTLVHTETGHGKDEKDIVLKNFLKQDISNKFKFISLRNLGEFPLEFISKIKVNNKKNEKEN